MDKDLNTLFQKSMKPVMIKHAKKYKSFFTQEEFENNMGEIFIITGAVKRLENKLKKLES